MSITISINNNESYVDEHCPEKRIKLDMDCQCCDLSEDHSADPDCPVCGGTGEDPILAQMPFEYPWEMNVANRNFGTIWNALGLDQGKQTVHPLELLKTLQSVHPALMERACVDHTQVGPNGQLVGARSFEFGVDAERVQYYIGKLLEIAEEAARREELVVWS